MQATWGLMAIGLVMRICRYLLRFPLWGDECFVAANFLDRGYLDLLRPLDYFQVCPLLFLWVELAVVKLWGFTEWSLRLFPCLCSLGSLFLFRHVASRLLRGVPLLLAIGIFAVAYYPVRHGAEVKPYASDLFVSLVLLSLAIECWRDPRSTRWLWALVVLSPIALGLSYPAVFVAGGICIGLAPVVWNARCRRLWIPFGIYTILLPATFLCLLKMTTEAQYESALDEGRMGAYWAASFPPLTQPLPLIVWLIESHTSHMFAYPLGGARGASTLTFICFVVGAFVLARRGRPTIMVMLMAPFALTLVAAAFERYPYGGSTRVSLFLAPIICVLAGLGAARLLAAFRRERLRRCGLASVVLVLATIGAAIMSWDLTHPYKTTYDRDLREFAREFWTEQAADAELVCAWTDMKQDLFPRKYSWRSMAQYLSNQRIYSARHCQGGHAPHVQAISAEHPLRCVVYSLPDVGGNEGALSEWLAGMQSRFELTRVERHDFSKNHEHGPPDRERIEVYEFVPPGSPAEEPRLEPPQSLSKSRPRAASR